MPAPETTRLYRFGVFEADLSTGELRRQGVRIKLNSQPFQLLVLLLERPGQLVTREEIAHQLWPDGTFVDFDHGLNSAVNRIREALGDSASTPRFVETLARRGYRFIAPVELVSPLSPASQQAPPESVPPQAAVSSAPLLDSILATAPELPRSPRTLVRTLFLLLQGMYLAFYIGSLANLPEIAELLSGLPRSLHLFPALICTAAMLLPIRFFVLFLALFQPPEARTKYLRLWPLLFVLDELWSLSPFLLLHHIDAGVALACTALLVYAPFAQRSLVLMGALAPQGERNLPSSPSV